MSHGGYEQYGGNPYGDVEQGGAGGYASSQPYQSTGGYGASNPYGSQGAAPPQQFQQQPINLQQSQSSRYATQQPSGGAPPPAQTSSVLSESAFLERIDYVRAEINTLTSNISQISTLHQGMLGSPDNSKTAQLNDLVSSTQLRNTHIKDQIRLLQVDAAKSNGSTVKNGQVASLRATFEKQLTSFQNEEQQYRGRYREQIKRQYQIVNPDASQQEMDEAANADWGDEGVFQTALKSNRGAAATSTLSSVRARHADIQQIEKTLMELQGLFQDLAAAVEIQEPATKQIEEKGQEAKENMVKSNIALTKGVKSARNYRKGKWICFFIVLAIIVILALVLGLYFGLRKTGNNNNNNNNMN